MYVKKAQSDLEKMWGEQMIEPIVPTTYRLFEAPRAMGDLADRKILGKATLAL